VNRGRHEGRPRVRFHVRPIRGLLLGVLGVVLAGNAGAETGDEFWPELDVWIPLSEPARLLFTFAGTRDRDTGDRSDADFGLYVDYRATARVSWRAGYVYSTGQPSTPDEARSIEHRLTTDFTYRWPFGETAQLADRTRLDLRGLDQDISYRVRNRLRLEYTGRVRTWSVTSYASVEAFYDSRFDAVSRYRIELGASAPITRAFEAELYFGWQQDSHSSQRYTNGVGITLTLNVR
jgi:hypothetical protein